MRLQFPTRVSMFGVLMYAAFVFVAQQFQHTSLAFSLLYFGFVMLTGAAFNLAGGFNTVVGAYVCWYWLFTCGLGVSFKIVFNEAADSNLTVPLLDIAVYTASMAMLLLVIAILKKLDLRRYALATSGFANFGTIDSTRTAWGFWVLGTVTLLLNEFFARTPGSIIAALDYVNIFYPLGVIFGTIAAIRQSNGRRAFNAVNVLCMVPVFIYYGLMPYSKQGLMTPLVLWVVSAAYCKLRLRATHYIFIAAIVFFALFFAPVWAVGRNTVPEEGLGPAAAAELVIFNLQHFDALQEQLASEAAGSKELGKQGYFDERHGLLNRLGIIEVDDQLFAFTDKGNYEGYAPISLGFLNWIPHFLTPNKSAGVGGHQYAQEIGGFLSEEDTSTGVSFSPAGEAFHIDGWTGIIVALPAIWVLLFVTIDLVVGDIRLTPWGLFVVVYFAHAASESGTGDLINFIFFGNLSLVVAILFTAKVAPVIGTLISSRARQPSLGIS